MINWISVKDRLPDTPGIYLTKYKGDKRQLLDDKMWIRTYPYSNYWMRMWKYSKPTKYSVTHWAEINLPEDKP